MVSKGAVLALDLGAQLAFDLGPLLALWPPLALNMGPQLAPGARGHLQRDCVGSSFMDSLLLQQPIGF